MTTKCPSEMTQDELLEKAAEAERLANEMEAGGDHRAARAFRQEAEGWLEDAIARD